MRNESADAEVDPRRVAAIMRELSLDLLRAMEASVPVALAQAAPHLSPEHRIHIANRVFAETKTRYAALAAATLIAIDASEPR